jgi:hypothetical protein
MASQAKMKKFDDAYRLKSADFKEANRKTLCYVNLITTVITVGLAVYTAQLIVNDETLCQKGDININITMKLMFGMHVTNAFEAIASLTWLDKVIAALCGCCCTCIFFIYEIAVLTYMMTIFFQSEPCKVDTPKKYYWLMANIFIYWGLLIVTCLFHLRACCHTPNRKEVEDEVNGEEELEKKNTMQ